jgi:hypothetical protein
MKLSGTEADYLEYVALLLGEEKLRFVRMARLVSNASEMHDSEVERLGQVFDPDRSKVPDLSDPWDAFRAAHFEIQDGKRNYRFQTHANAEVHFQYYQWLQSLEGISAEAVKAELDAAIKEENEHSLRYYRREVDELLKSYKAAFEGQMRKAKDPEFLIGERVGWWTYVLMPDKAENVRPEWEREYNSKPIYQRLRHESGSVRAGNRVPSIVRKPDLKRLHPQHEAEARLEFLQWLEGLKKHPERIQKDATTGENIILSDAVLREIEVDKSEIWATGCRDIVEYFSTPKGAEVKLFRNGNAHFLEEVRADIADLMAARHGSGNIPTPWRTIAQLEAHRIIEPDGLEALLRAKFSEFGSSRGSRSLYTFAQDELKTISQNWKADFADRFPVTEQWKYHLKTVSEATEQPQPAPPITNPQLLAVVSDNGFQEYHDETHKYFEHWQPFLPASMSHEDRFELDTEAYKKTYFGTPHQHDAPFKEGVLLKRLIKNLKPAKHPAHVSYRDYLKGLLKATEQPAPATEHSTPAETNKASTGAEIERKPQGIIFTDPETIKAIHEGLKGFFQGNETELLTLLKGGTVAQPLHFPDQQNRLAEVFSRAHHCQKIAGTKTDLQNWIAQNFTYLNRRKQKPSPCNPESLRNVFSPKEGTSEIPRNKRIVITGLPYIPLSERVDRGSS